MKPALLLGFLVLGCTTQQPKPSAAPAATPAPTSAPAPVSAEALVDHAGDSLDTAIAVPVDAPNEGVDFQNNWIFDRYGRFRREGGGTGFAGGRRYNVVKVELANGEKKTVYFDITENWTKWSPHQP